jgi:hypothetical protein
MVSLFIETSGGGLSLKELIDRIETKLWTHSELILKIHATVAETLGDGMPAAFNVRFDEQVAASSLQTYELADVPPIRQGIPAAVSQIRFRFGLSNVPAASLSALGARNRHLAALLPAAQ